MKNPKDTITNIVALVIIIATAVQQTLATMAGAKINWLMILSNVGIAVVGWYTGKKSVIV